jgi:hypothetical protein
MPTSKPIDIPWPLSSFPGNNVQESSGRLINCYAEPLGTAQSGTGGQAVKPPVVVWRGSPGLSQFALTGQTGYRGGLIVNNLSYECFLNNASTIDANGTVVSLGAFAGSNKVSIARNQKSPSPDVVAVDIANGAFTLSGGGAPVAYNGGGNLPQPNGVCFQDGYFHFSIGDNRLFASGINALTQNSNTFTTCNAKASANLLRPIPYAGLLLAFTTASIEVYQDTAQTFPAYPYQRMQVLDVGLLQANAIAGFEDFFSDLSWVGQDFGVYRMPSNSIGYDKISPPDLDRLIEAQALAGHTLEASCYVFGGKRFWVLSSPDWTWEFNLGTQKWNERSSLDATGNFKRWRATGGHPAFGKWLMGDVMSGNFLYVDDTMNDENGAVLRMRMESGPVADFPNRLRVPRADFNFVTGVGQPTRALTMNVLGAVAGNGNAIRLTVLSTARIAAGDTGQVAAVTGTIEANGTWPLVVIDAQHVELAGSNFVHAYVSGGTLTDITTPPNVQDPTVAISWSDDNGVTYRNPRVQKLGQVATTKNTRIEVKLTGMSGPQARRWRMDISDPVYRGFLGATQSTDPKEF